MNVNHIQIPKKVGIATIKSALATTDFGTLPAPELEIIEYTNLYIIDGIFSDEHRNVLSAALSKSEIAHF